jgi:hypothetical protein
MPTPEEDLKYARDRLLYSSCNISNAMLQLNVNGSNVTVNYHSPLKCRDCMEDVEEYIQKVWLAKTVQRLTGDVK